jgi:hypothetical protein
MIEKINNFQENNKEESLFEKLNKIRKNTPPYLMPILLSFLTSCVEKQGKTDLETIPIESNNKNEGSNGTEIIDVLLENTFEEYRLGNGLMQDPAFEIIYQLHYDKKYPKSLEKLSEKEKAEWTMRIARNMHIMGVEITEENFNKILEETLEVRSNSEIAEKELFKDRNIAVFAGNEEWEEISLDDSVSIIKEDRFGDEKTIEGLRNKDPKNLELFKAKGDKEDYIKTYESFQIFVATKEKLTIVFDAHGSPYEIKGHQDYPNDTKNKQDSLDVDFYGTMSPKLLSGMLIARYKNGITDTPIIITTSCFGQNFMRNLYEEINEKNNMWDIEVPLPIIITSTEYGQYGFSSHSSEYNNSLFENILKNENPKIKDVFEIEAKRGEETGIYSNISIFVPAKDSRTYFQIAKNENKESEASKRLFQDALERGLISDKNISLFEIRNPEEAAKIKDEFIKNKETNEKA